MKHGGKGRGSDPVPGVLEVSPNVKSIAAFRNYNPSSELVEFVYDVKNDTFAVGKPKPYVNLTGSPHQKLAASIGADPTNIVAGMFRRHTNGEIMLNEHSGHFWQNWDKIPGVREKLKQFLEKTTGQQVIMERSSAESTTPP